MLALRLSASGRDYGKSSRRECWVAALSLDARGSVAREFLRPMKDHGNNETLIFFLAPDSVYEVCASDSRNQKYYCTAENEKVSKIGLDRAIERLSAGR